MHAWFTETTGITLPFFVPRLIAGIRLSNTVPVLLPRLRSPRAHRRARAPVELCAADLPRDVADENAALDYQAAVLSGGFTGLSLGSTPIAIASMSAITRRYGPSPNAFVRHRQRRRLRL